MKKIYLIIAILTLSIAVNATTINITPTSPNSSNNLRQVLASAATGDIIEMAAGTYEESGAWIAIDDKEVTVRAAEGAEVIIKPQYSVRVKAPNAAAKAEFVGVKFDCSALESSELFVPSDDQPNQKVILDKCELYNWPNNNALIHSTSARRLDVISINDCYFHGFEKSIVFVENTNLVSLSITNSTFADVSASITDNYYAAPIDVRATSGEVLIDHCTFYNVKTMSASYGVIMVNNISDVTISNSILAHPTSNSNPAIKLNGGTVENSLIYNYTGGTDGIQGATTTTDCVTGNPYFVNAEAGNYDFTPASFSPAHEAGTDDKNLGDLRWKSSDSAHPTTKNITAGTDAIKSAIEAAWPEDEIVLATGTYEESGNISVDKEITIKAANGASPIVKPVGNFAISNAADVTIQNIKFDGSDQSGVSNFIYAADATSNSLAVEGCEFYNFSNAVIYAADSKLIGTCSVNNCYFYDNTHSCVSLKNSAAANLSVSNSTFNNIDASDIEIGIVESKTATGTVLVNHCTFYNCKVKNTDYGITKVASPSATVSNCIFAMPTSTSSLRTVYIPSGLSAGTKVTNCIMHNFTQDSNIGVPARGGTTITNCSTADPLFTDAAEGDFTYPGNYETGNVSPARYASTDGTDLGDPRWYTEAIYPTTDFSGAGYDFAAERAALSGNILLETGGPDDPYLRYYHAYDPGTAEWIIKTTRPCYVEAIVNMADNTWNYKAGDATRQYFQNHKHLFAVEIFDSENQSVGSVAEVNDNEGDGHDTPYPTFPLPESIYIPEAGIYTVRLSNTRHESRCGVASVTLRYSGGLTTELPGLLKGEDAVLVAQKMYHDVNGDIHYGNYGTVPTDEYAYWRITTTAAFSGKVILNIPAESRGSGHEFHVELYSSLDGSILSEAYETDKSYDSDRLIELEQTFTISEAGDYYIKLINETQWSSAVLRSIAIAPAVTIDEDETDIDDVIGANNGNTVNVSLKRSFTGGMYNTICLPFAVNESEMNRVFPGAKVQELTSSSIEDGGFVLNLEFTEVNTLEAGKPYLIWPAANVTNPKFLAVTIDEDLHNSETTNADFVGNFVKGTIEESVDNLFLGADNMLYFPTTNVTIKGMRAYFQVKNPSGPSLIRSARIVTNEEETTDIDIVTLDNETTNTAVRKVLQEGQLYIIRDNAIFNVQGQRVK